MAPGGAGFLPPVDDVRQTVDGVHIERADTANKWKTLWGMKRYCIWILYITLGTTMQGFDFSVFGNLLAYQSFAQKFGEFDTMTQSYIVSAGIQAIWNASSSSCQVIGGFLSGWIMDKIGRRYFYLASGCIGIIGIGVVYGASNYQIFALGRAILGFSIGCISTFSPLYIGENSVPELRGFFLVSFNTFIVVGQFLIALISRAVVDVQGEWQYKIPILTMFFFNAVLVLLWPLMPESPYYLLSKHNDREGARKALRRLYGSGKDEFIDTEIIRLEHNIETSNKLCHLTEGKPKLSDAFRGQNLQRTFAAFMAAAAQMFCGVIFVVGYIPYFLTLAGIPNPFNWNMYLFLINLLGNLASFYTVERFGRRKFIVWGLGIMAVLNLIIGGLNVSPTEPKLYATIALTYIWALTYQMSIGALGFAFASEVGSLALRQVTQSAITISNAGFAWVFVFTIPYMINPDAGNLGGKVGFIFGGLGFLTFIGAFFLFPETKGLTFSELDYLYSQKISPRRFTDVIKDRRAQGLVEDDVHHQKRVSVVNTASNGGKEEVAHVEEAAAQNKV